MFEKISPLFFIATINFIENTNLYSHQQGVCEQHIFTNNNMCCSLSFEEQPFWQEKDTSLRFGTVFSSICFIYLLASYNYSFESCDFWSFVYLLTRFYWGGLIFNFLSWYYILIWIFCCISRSTNFLKTLIFVVYYTSITTYPSCVIKPLPHILIWMHHYIVLWLCPIEQVA